MMTCSSELWDLYQRWKTLTEEEGAAILDSNWAEVRRCQNAKQQLQGEIVRLTDLARSACLSRAQEDEFQNGIRQRVNELIQLETQNNSILDSRAAALRDERDQLSRTARRLRRVHQSYAPARGPVWNHYS